MSGIFADSARQLAGLSALVLGWRPPEFWQATPAELATILHEVEPGPVSLSRAELAVLMERERDG